MVSLHPVEPPPAGEEAVHPIGYADEQGNFKLTTYETNDGAPPGQYKVTIIWFKEVEERMGEQPNLLPAKYSNPETSNLTVTITEGPTVLEPFNLTK
jgi:hypothetical protein